MLKRTVSLSASLLTAHLAVGATTYTIQGVADFAQGVFGNPDYSINVRASYPAVNFTYTVMANLPYADWSQLPGGTTAVAANGSVILFSPPPDGVTVDWSGLKSLFLLNNNVIPDGTTLSFESGESLTLWDHAGQSGEASGTSLTMSGVRGNNGVINFNVVLNGGSLCHASGRSLSMTGSLTGDSISSMVAFSGASKLTLTGALSYAGEFNCEAGQNGSGLYLKPSVLDAEKVIRQVSVGCTGGTDKAPQVFLFRPQQPGQTLRLRTLTTAQNADHAVLEKSNNYRQCGIVLLPEGNRIETEYLNGSHMHFLAENSCPATRDYVRTGTGVGYVDVTTECKTAAECHLCISTNIHFSVAKVTNAVVFDYTTEPDGVNAASLSITGSCNANASVLAHTPAMLPRTLSGFAGTVNLSTATTDWTFPVDFAAADPCPSACEGSGTLSVPTSGTVAITLAGTESVVREGSYPLLTATAGGEALSVAAWPATIDGEVCESKDIGDFRYAIVRDATGVRLSVTYIDDPAQPKLLFAPENVVLKDSFTRAVLISEVTCLGAWFATHPAQVRLTFAGSSGTQTVLRDLTAAGTFVFDTADFFGRLQPGSAYEYKLEVVNAGDGSVIVGTPVRKGRFFAAREDAWFSASAADDETVGGAWVSKPTVSAAAYQVEGENAFAATEAKSGAVSVTTHAAFPSAYTANGLAKLLARFGSSAPHGFLTVKDEGEGVCSWQGLVLQAGEPAFVTLSGATASLNTDYVCTVDIDRTGATPKVSYSVSAGGSIVRLSGAGGATWFDSPSAKATVSGVRYYGVGSVASFAAACGDAALASVGGVSYGSFSEALAAAEPADVVTLLTDVLWSPDLVGSWRLVLGGHAFAATSDTAVRAKFKADAGGATGLLTAEKCRGLLLIVR